MTKGLSFTVWGCPISQPRQRHTPLMVGGKPVIGRGGRPVVVNYTPKTAPAIQWKSDVKASAMLALDGFKLQEGPLRIDINVYFPRPQRLMRAKDPDFAIWHTARPDRDNIDKGILDALKGIIFVDDSQVCMGEIRKYYHEKGGRPRAEIKILVLE